MAMNFPEWFLFACIMLFSARRFPENFHIECTLLGASETGQSNDAESPCSSATAARYIAWIMNPMNKAHQDMLVDSLTKISGSWALKQFGSVTLNKQTRFGKKLKKPKFGSKDFTLPKGYNNQRIGLWLKEFDETFSCLGGKRSALLRKIPLGLLIGFSDLSKEEGCEQLLHYAATSTIRDEISSTWKAELKEAINGASLVFNLTDVVENMSATMFDNEELGVDFFSRVKERSRKYLIKCVRNIIQTDEDDRRQMLRDLSCRLLRWRHQGREVFQGDKDLDDILNSLDCNSYLKGIF